MTTNPPPQAAADLTLERIDKILNEPFNLHTKEEVLALAGMARRTVEAEARLAECSKALVHADANDRSLDRFQAACAAMTGLMANASDTRSLNGIMLESIYAADALLAELAKKPAAPQDPPGEAGKP